MLLLIHLDFQELSGIAVELRRWRKTERLPRKRLGKLFDGGVTACSRAVFQRSAISGCSWHYATSAQ
jgi:hypothetical protein